MSLALVFTVLNTFQSIPTCDHHPYFSVNKCFIICINLSLTEFSSMLPYCSMKNMQYLKSKLSILLFITDKVMSHYMISLVNPDVIQSQERGDTLVQIQLVEETG